MVFDITEATVPDFEDMLDVAEKVKEKARIENSRYCS